jgi:hypothetical protein
MGADNVQGLLAGLGAVPFWLAAAALLGGGLYLLHRGSRAFWRLRTITDTPTARLHSAAQGYVELRGLAQADEGTLRARLTGSSCLWYRFRVEQRQRSGRRDTWVTLEKGESERPFLLNDGTGRCRVEPAGARLHCRRRARWLGPSREPGRRAPRFLALGGWLPIPLGLGDRYRFTEERIEPDDPLYVLGRLETPRRGLAEQDRLRRSLLGVWKRDPARIAALDTNGDGRISTEEWERARIQAGRLAERSEQRRRLEPVLPVLRDTQDPRHPFLISSHTEEELVRGLGWTVAGSILGFVAVAAALGYALSARLGAAA